MSEVACPSCGESAVAEDRWCEACGAALAGPAPAAPSPADATAAWPLAPEDDPPERREVVDGPVAAVSDRGTAHWRNEDAVGLRWVDGDPPGFVMVVCDGVSLSQAPHVVSHAAVGAAVGVLTGAVAAGGNLGAAMADAAGAAQRAAAGVPFDPSLDLGPGACTFVAAAVRGREAAFASVGDSRAYWVDAEGAIQISQDDSLAAELVASGGYTSEQAMTMAGAHALTKWLGVDSTDAEPTVTAVELTVPGLVVLASDGLWNYAPEPEDLARLVGRPGSESALAVARRLAAFAEASGGADNITVAVGPWGWPDRREGP